MAGTNTTAQTTKWVRFVGDTTQLTIGSEVWCSDDVCGDLKRVVIDPVGRVLTHLVVAPQDGPGPGRVVPIDLVDPTTREIRLRCTMADFEKLEEAESTRFISGAEGPWDYGQEDMLSWPYYGLWLGGGMAGGSMGGMGASAGTNPGAHEVTYDRVPVGEVQVRRGEHVHATDGDIGKVQGLVIDPRDHHVTHVLLDEGHLWGHKRVAIPIGSVTGVEDGVRLGLTKDEVRDLPPVDLDEEA
jgi:sporulation protein YlmC with PRC-barrel domain